MLDADPMWDSLPDHPRFQALLAKYELGRVRCG